MCHISAGLDYVAFSGTVTFQPGVNRQCVTLQLLDDDEDEPDECLIVRATSQSSSLTIAPVPNTNSPEALVCCIDDDGKKEKRKMTLNINQLNVISTDRDAADINNCWDYVHLIFIPVQKICLVLSFHQSMCLNKVHQESVVLYLKMEH